MYAKVLIEREIKSLDRTFTYVIPSVLKKDLKPGMSVKVPFGKNKVKGLVIEICSSLDEENVSLKNIEEIINKEIYFSDELLKLGEYIKKETFCPLIKAYKSMLPSSLKIASKAHELNKYENIAFLNENFSNISYTKKQKEIIDILVKEKEKNINEFSKSIVDNLVKKGAITIKKRQVYRLNGLKKIDRNELSLTSDQKKVLNDIIEDLTEYKTHLIYGVTASGKTEVYFRLIEDVLAQNKSALVCVPEITLTQQMINRFYERFGSIVAIYHSGLSDGEKNDEYLKIYRGEAKIVVGTRSAVFAPLKNLGIIIIDEEHSDNFKQESSPRYNAIDVAKFRAKYHNIPLILGSATPSFESMARAERNIYTLHVMKNRVGLAILPRVSLVDMANEIKNGNSLFSAELKTLINKAISENKQTILLLNRRGFAPFVSCSNCGYTYKCKNCDITLTYHKSTNNLRCHYCGYTVFKSELCPSCHEKSLSFLGIGTEKLEEEAKRTFKNARICRMDVDTTRKKGSHEKILNDFKNHNYDILIGTQMISKGLDFPLVTVVGVLNADATLNIPDFRSSERTFALLDQVSGRAGRGDTIGNVIIQTYNPDNTVLKCVKNHDYLGFYNYEMNIRKKLFYPPFSFITGIKIISRDYELAQSEAEKICSYIKKNMNESTIVLGPSAANLFKFNNNYRFQLVIKYKADKKLFQCLKDILLMYKENNKIIIEIDNNPLKI